MKERSVAIFCGASSGNDESYRQLAKNFIRELHERKITLVYGGAGIGLMGLLANEMLHLGGKITGIIPEKLFIKEVAHQGITDLRVVKTMHERKNLMYELSDAFFILPGGMGTMDEFFEILTWKQLGHHHKPIFVLNSFGYFDHLLSWFEHATEHGFIKNSDKKLFHVLQDISQTPWEFI